MSDGIPNDALLEFSWKVNQEVSRQHDAEAAGPRQGSSVWIDPAEILEAQRREARIAAREGRNGADERKAEEERRLIAYLAAKYGPSGSVWEPPISDHARRDIEFRDLTGGIIRNWLV